MGSVKKRSEWTMDMPKIEYPMSDHSNDSALEEVKDLPILEESDGEES